MKRLIPIFLVAVAACASGQKYADVESRIPPHPPQKGRVFFYRSGSAFGSGVQPKIRLDGKEVGSSLAGGFFFVDLAPGNYTVSCSTEAKLALSFTLQAGEVRYVRTTVSMGFFVGHVQPELVDPQKAKAEIAKCKYTGPAESLKP